MSGKGAVIISQRNTAGPSTLVELAARPYTPACEIRSRHSLTPRAVNDNASRGGRREDIPTRPRQRANLSLVTAPVTLRRRRLATVEIPGARDSIPQTPYEDRMLLASRRWWWICQGLGWTYGHSVCSEGTAR